MTRARLRRTARRLWSSRRRRAASSAPSAGGGRVGGRRTMQTSARPRRSLGPAVLSYGAHRPAAAPAGARRRRRRALGVPATVPIVAMAAPAAAAPLQRANPLGCRAASSAQPPSMRGHRLQRRAPSAGAERPAARTRPCSYTHAVPSFHAPPLPLLAGSFYEAGRCPRAAGRWHFAPRGPATRGPRGTRPCASASARLRSRLPVPLSMPVGHGLLLLDKTAERQRTFDECDVAREV